MLASAIGQAPVDGPVVVNERTTVATGFAFAQFVDGAAIAGNSVGMLNAVRMAGNMVRARSGKPGRGSPPPAQRFRNVGAADLQLARQHRRPLRRDPLRLRGPARRDHAAGRTAPAERPPGDCEHRQVPVAERRQAVRAVPGAEDLCAGARSDAGCVDAVPEVHRQLLEQAARTTC